MQILTAFTPGATEKFYVLGGRNGNLLLAYVEAPTPKEAFVRYAALPVGLRDSDASFAFEVTTDAYVQRKKGFLY